MVVTSGKTALRYGLRLPREALASRACVVCGTAFVPRTPEVRSCGKICGARRRWCPRRFRDPTCPDCGEPFTGTYRCMACQAEHGSVQAILRTIGVLGDKHVPGGYLRASERQRRDLLAGLLDTDGTVARSGSVQIAVTSRRLAEDSASWSSASAIGAGGRPSASTGAPQPRRPPTSSASSPTTTCSALSGRARPQGARSSNGSRAGARASSASPAGPIGAGALRPGRQREHLYLAGASMIPTHNSTLALDFAPVGVDQARPDVASSSLWR